MNRTQWVATLSDLLVLVNHTVRPGERIYLSGGPLALQKFWVVAKLRTRIGVRNYRLEDMKVYEITKQQVEMYLVNQGETLPSSTRMFLKHSDPSSLILDEVWLTDDTLPGAL